jgi:hypothetical protein
MKSKVSYSPLAHVRQMVFESCNLHEDVDFCIMRRIRTIIMRRIRTIFILVLHNHVNFVDFLLICSLNLQCAADKFAK